MRIVCISDTHQQRVAVPDGDVLIHAGDLTWEGEPIALMHAFGWLDMLPHKHKIVIAGNHDFGFYQVYNYQGHGFTALHNSGIEIDGVKFWGSPYTPRYGGWDFMHERGESMRRVWESMPEKVDVLITHGPPMGILDRTPSGIHAGCEELLVAVGRVKPKLHVFGHIHGGYGRVDKDGATFVNASICDEDYLPKNPAVVVEL